MMGDKNKEIAKDPVRVLLDLLIVVLAIACIGAAGFAINRFAEPYSWHYEEDSFYNALEWDEFARTVSMYYYNEAQGSGADSRLQECYGVAKYFEAASYYKMFAQNGEEQKAEAQKAKMEAALQEMGEFTAVKEKIDRQLGITE